MLTVEKFIKTNKIFMMDFPEKKKCKSKGIKFEGMFADIGKRLKKEGKTSVDLIREIREGR